MPANQKIAQRSPETAGRFRISFPRTATELAQDEEWFAYDDGSTIRRLRVHDYAEIYKRPGLYEALVYDALGCTSPPRVADLLVDVLADWPLDPSDLRVLDLGAGNGIVAQELRGRGVECCVGLDLLPEAAAAAERDRPGVYDDYVVADLCDLADDERKRLEKARLNCLVSVAALGFGDIPPEAFARAVNSIATPGWIAITIKEGFLDRTDDDSGFARLLRLMIDRRLVEVQAHRRFCHRVSIDGEQIFYVALIARKVAEVDMRLARDFPDAAGAGAAAKSAMASIPMAVEGEASCSP